METKLFLIVSSVYHSLCTCLSSSFWLSCDLGIICTSLCSCSTSLIFRLFPFVVIRMVSNFSEVFLKRKEKCFFSFDHIFHDYLRFYLLCFSFGYFSVQLQSFQCFCFYLICSCYFEFHFYFCFTNDCLYLVSCFLFFLQSKHHPSFY